MANRKHTSTDVDAVIDRLSMVQDQILALRGMPRSNRVAHNRKSLLYRLRKQWLLKLERLSATLH